MLNCIVIIRRRRVRSASTMTGTTTRTHTYVMFDGDDTTSFSRSLRLVLLIPLRRRRRRSSSRILLRCVCTNDERSQNTPSGSQNPFCCHTIIIILNWNRRAPKPLLCELLLGRRNIYLSSSADLCE